MIKIGDKDLKNCYIGTKRVKKIMKGGEQIWPLDPPPMVENYQITMVSSNAIYYSWKSQPELDHYIVKRYINGVLDNTLTVDAEAISNTWVTGSTRIVGDIYKQEIWAVRQGIEGAKTSISYTVPMPDDVTAPSVPTGLEPFDITMNTFSIDWEHSTDNVGVTGYDILLQNTTLIENTVKPYNSGNHGSAGEVRVKVRAKDAAGNLSAWSAERKVYLKLIPPTITLTELTPTSIKYDITSTGNKHDGLVIQYSTASSFSNATTIYNSINNEPVRSYSGTLTVQAGSSHYFRAYVYDSTGNHPGSAYATKSITTGSVQLATPEVDIIGSTLSSITIRFVSITGSNRYRVDVSTNSNFSSPITQYFTTPTYEITGLSGNVNYFIRVRAENTTNGAIGGWGYTEGGTGALPTPPYDINVNMVGSRLYASWKHGQNAENYVARYYYVGYNNEQWYTYSQIPPSSTSYDVTVLTGRTLVFQIGLSNQFGIAWSEQITVNT